MQTGDWFRVNGELMFGLGVERRPLKGSGAGGEMCGLASGATAVRGFGWASNILGMVWKVIRCVCGR